jgi:saccharopine dehydrogenase (NADP+, L-glutamate forming)
MTNIFVIGAGRTATALITYLLNNSAEQSWNVTVGDFDNDLAEQKIAGHPAGRAIKFNALNDEHRGREISKADIVISFLPPDMHELIAKECLKNKTNMITASYVSAGMMKLDEDVKSRGLIFLNEMGLDPGIDHMDVMQLKEKVENEDGKIISLKSFCGALITPESDDNPWHYKFTWSPMNVVLAGQGNARYKENSKIKEVSYSKLFLNTEQIEVPGLGAFEAYPNRDSVSYIKKYNLNGVENFYRGTLRRPGYSEAWNTLVRLGLTDNKKLIKNAQNLTLAEWVKSNLPSPDGKPADEEIAGYLGIDPGSSIMQKLRWLDLFSDKKINTRETTSAGVLLDLLMDKWEFKDGDQDMVVLQTEIIYTVGERKKKILSTMIHKGQDRINTAMTYTGGLPVGIAAKLIANKMIREKGVVIPVHKDIYSPVLKELEDYGINFSETEVTLN